ncbi:DUF3466 family protein [Vibrio panuliri]|uniref:GlyGly-CTERM sorting domain-containing protein n=1 Tax=Vibrio panuliri TaxID=1381081 RepID=A0ABX3FCK5_9VIBR|nr:DUF3466 family protein [Vibrio panuliri]KAB1454413.1 DUF3466 family protein [Vibrio panuliri]OLQ87766.1 GlyGly-CTERM sorting domain-containing protein [Vibrio panuliri]
MRSNLFKLSAVAATICASFAANSAIYNVVDVYQPVVDQNARTFGVAIQPSALGGATCWTTDCSSSDYLIAFEEQLNNQGFLYRDESPFRLSNGFDYLEDNLDGFERYCRDWLGYNTNACDEWAKEQYTQGFALEGPANNNSYAYIESSATKINAGKNNVIVNSFGSTPASDALGTYYGDSLQNRSIAYKGTTPLAKGSYDQTKAWAELGNIIVGSVSEQRTDNTNDYLSNAAIWNNGTLVVIANQTNSPNDRRVPQGSARDIASVTGTPYAVGYTSNNESERIPVASVFNLTTASSPSVTRITDFSDDDKYLSSVLTHVNNNGVAIGEAKNRNPQRAYANALFYVSNVASPNSYTMFSGGIFFDGANGKAGAINNFNEVVGQIDYETKAEVGGTERAKRAFVTTIGDKSTSPLKGQSRYLDDLTMGTGALSSNNQYRIIDATDINDAGVISATALYCAGGYDTQAINSTCQGGTPGTEKLRAVKLVPINGADASQIQPRVVDSETIEREGGSVGWFALGLLTLLGFRRKQ